MNDVKDVEFKIHKHTKYKRIHAWHNKNVCFFLSLSLFLSFAFTHAKQEAGESYSNLYIK